MNRSDASSAHCVRHLSCLLRHCLVQSADGPLRSLLSVFGVQFVPWWRAAHKRPLTAFLSSMLQVGCVLKWKIDIGGKKKSLLPSCNTDHRGWLKRLKWLIWHNRAEGSWFMLPLCVYRRGGSLPAIIIQRLHRAGGRQYNVTCYSVPTPVII